MKKTLIIAMLAAMTALTARAQEMPYPLDTIKGTPVYKYTVEKSIGLYRISKMFGCKQEDILKLNPHLEERGLHWGEVIYVPNISPAPQEENLSSAQQGEDLSPAQQEGTLSPQGERDSIALESVEAVEAVDSVETAAEDDGSVRIGLLLPLHANAVERTQVMERFWDFYEGCLIAVYDVQNSGQKIDVKVFDTEKSDARVQHLIESGELDDRHAVIGPAYGSMVNVIGPWAKEKQIQVLVPFTNQVSDIDTNPYMIRFNSSPEQEAEAIADYLSRDSAVNCVLVDQPEADIPEGIRVLRKAVKAHGIPYTETTIRKILADSLSEALVEGKENVIILNSEKYQNIQLLLPRLMNGRGGKELTLLSPYSWQKENIILPQIYATVFATEVPASMEHYDEVYEQYFHHAHASQNPRYDLLGYDLMRMMLARLMGEEYHGLQSDIVLEPVGEGGGMVNTRVIVVRK